MDEANGDRGDEDKETSGSASPIVAMSNLLLLPGENVSHLGKTRDSNDIVLSNYRLHVSLHEDSVDNNFVNVPLSCIESVEAKDLFFVHVNCKDARYYRISFGDNATCEDWHQRILAAISPFQNIEESFAYIHHIWATEAGFEELEDEVAGPDDETCDAFRHEVSRLGFDLSGSWRISSLNKDLQFCPTYPPDILIPACISDQVLEKVASFRSAKRIPAVVWRHMMTGAVLARCSQPEVGWLGWRSADDEDLVRAIADATAFDNRDTNASMSTVSDSEKVESLNDGDSSVPSLKDLSAEAASVTNNKSKVLIVDARSYPAAVGNRARGGGVECIEYYPFAEIIFMSLGNIHNIRKSFQALRALCNQTPAETFSGGAGWLAALDATKWLYHASGLLKAASRVATALHDEGRSVLVHCSDGWDRTPQVVSLAQLMLDPYYRSIDGFRTLVEICWLDFGHKMADRNGTVLGISDPNERAPIFLQWLDCVHQLLLQFPCHFEFNLSFLVKLAQHTFSSLFGTFLCNSLHDRRKHKVSQKSRSVWDYLEHHHVKFRNFLYESKPKEPLDPIWPRCEVRDLLLWKDVYVVSDQKPPLVITSTVVTNANGTSTNSSGMNSRCDELPSSMDQVDSGANSSREDEERGTQSPPKNEMKQVHVELEKLSVEAAAESSSKSLNLTSLQTQRKLGKPGSRAIESSTDTLVAVNQDLEQVDIDQMPMEPAENQTVFSSHDDDPSPPPPPRPVPETRTNNIASSSQQSSEIVIAANASSSSSAAGADKSLQKLEYNNLGGCPSNCLIGWDLSQYFKEPIDTDGLTAHHNQVQERLVRIFATHQAEVQALRRDLQSTRVALLRQKSSSSSSRAGDELLSVEIEASKHTNAAVNSGSSSTGACSDASSTWEAVDEKEANPTLWIPDHAVAACMKCNTNFWIGRRRHHCRNCGCLFCRDCSNRMIPIPSEQLYHPVRVCDDCFAELVRNKKAITSATGIPNEQSVAVALRETSVVNDNQAF